MSKELFLASEFVATKFSSTAEKAEFGNALLKFLDADCAPGLFTNRLYQRLSMTFGHIAHYNRFQFYEERFASLSAQIRFLEHTLRFPCYGDPEFTFSDLESEIQREVRNRNYLPRYQLRLAEEQRAGELILLERLEGKYRNRREDPEECPASVSPPDGGEGVEPVQGLLF
jgi:hypothetical protein